MNQISDNGVTSPSEKSNSRPIRLRYLALGIVLGSVLAIIGIVAIAILNRERLDPPITMHRLDEEVERWKEHGPKSYDLDLDLSGVNAATVHVEVRDGEVTGVTYNGRKLESRTWDDWSVPGLFAIIRIDIESCMTRQSGGQTGSKAADVEPRGVFDERYGYPLRYRRVTPTGADAKWRVTHFAAK